MCACLTNLYGTWRFLKRLSEDEKYKDGTFSGDRKYE